jgi:YidC/Oxa1 family membrane protein insertase
MSYLWEVLIHQPLYNGLVFLISIVPGGNIAVAIILLTLIVKIFLFPLTKKSIRTQVLMRKLEPELALIKGKGKNKEEQARQTMELYKKHKVNPFSSCLIAIIQVFIAIGLYRVLTVGIVLDPKALYSFISFPEIMTPLFLGIINTHTPSYILAALAGISQYFLAALLPAPAKSEGNKAPTFQEDLARNMQMQMKYVLPFVIFVIAVKFPAAIALYWVVSNLFSIGQEIVIRKSMEKYDVKNPEAVA